MTQALLDVNVLLALFDLDHVAHDVAQGWWDSQSYDGWASCPITELGFLRVTTQPRYPNPLPMSAAAGILDRARSVHGHVAWECGRAPLDAVDLTRIHGPGQLTDAYLLALAVHHDGTFATLDRRVVRTGVPAAKPRHLTLI